MTEKLSIESKKLIHENEVISEFLLAEIKSSRFSQYIYSKLNELKLSEAVITSPNLKDKEENRLRRKILDSYRNFTKREGLFEGLSKNIIWYSAILSKEIFLNYVFYMNYSYWNELSEHTRLPSKAATNILKGVRVFDVDNSNMLNFSKTLTKTTVLNRIILLQKPKSDELVILEGHFRATCMALNASSIPDRFEVIIGESESWSGY